MSATCTDIAWENGVEVVCGEPVEADGRCEMHNLCPAGGVDEVEDDATDLYWDAMQAEVNAARAAQPVEDDEDDEERARCGGDLADEGDGRSAGICVNHCSECIEGAREDYLLNEAGL